MKITIETDTGDAAVAPVTRAAPQLGHADLNGGGSPLGLNPEVVGGDGLFPSAGPAQGIDAGPVADWLVQAIQGSEGGSTG